MPNFISWILADTQKNAIFCLFLKFQRTTERCHHTEYERVCPVKFWYYNNLITNRQNTLIIDKQTTKTTPNEV
jgi:hypothetical protein